MSGCHLTISQHQVCLLACSMTPPPPLSLYCSNPYISVRLTAWSVHASVSLAHVVWGTRALVSKPIDWDIGLFLASYYPCLFWAVLLTSPSISYPALLTRSSTRIHSIYPNTHGRSDTSTSSCWNKNNYYIIIFFFFWGGGDSLWWRGRKAYVSHTLIGNLLTGDIFMYNSSFWIRKRVKACSFIPLIDHNPTVNLLMHINLACIKGTIWHA